MSAVAERWAPVVGYEGVYEVSDQGRIRSLPRTTIRKGRPAKVYGRILRINTTGNRYPTIQLTHGGVKRSWLVHRILLEAFVGPAPEGMEGCHNNGDPWDCRLENLRWDTHSANGLDSVAHGTNFGARKTHCKHGHEFTPENTYRPPSGRSIRMCRACMNQRKRARRGSVVTLNGEAA